MFKAIMTLIVIILCGISCEGFSDKYREGGSITEKYYEEIDELGLRLNLHNKEYLILMRLDKIIEKLDKCKCCKEDQDEDG